MNAGGDRRLRNLERRLGSGDFDAEVALWSERLRRGEVSAESLGLAAYLGHAAARQALGTSAPSAPGNHESWVAGLRQFGQVAWVRAALAGAQAVVALWEHNQDPPDPRPSETLDAVRAWLHERSAERAKTAHAHSTACYQILGELEERGPEGLTGRRPWPEVWATAFRETRAAGLVALSAAEPGDMSFHYAKLSLAATRERLALKEVPGGPGGAALFERAAQVDRLGHMPELATQRSAVRVQRLIRDALLDSSLES